MRLFFTFFIINACIVLRYSVTYIQRLGNKPKPTGENNMTDLVKKAQKVEALLVKYGNNEAEAKKMVAEHFDYVWNHYTLTAPSKIAMIISSLGGICAGE